MTGTSNQVLVALLQARTGQQLPPSRQWRIGTALSGLFREHEISNVDQLVALLHQSREASLARKVVEALLNNETYFFRDRGMFDLISQQVLPDLAMRRASSRRISIWSVGCSTGQEALSLAMLFAEQEARWAGWTIDILGTDVSESVVDVASRGCYSQFQIQRGLGVAQMLQWFEETPDGWQVNDRLRRMCHFKVHNMLESAPAAGRFDLVLCRNVLLYFDGAIRSQAFVQLANQIAADGWLMLGAGETVIGQTDLFAPDSHHSGLYRIASSDVAKSGQQSRYAARA